MRTFLQQIRIDHVCQTHCQALGSQNTPDTEIRNLPVYYTMAGTSERCAHSQLGERTLSRKQKQQRNKSKMKMKFYDICLLVHYTYTQYSAVKPSKTSLALINFFVLILPGKS